MKPYVPAACACCRKVILVQSGADLAPPWRWARFDGELFDKACCSNECQAKGPAQPIREAVQAFVDLDRQAKITFRIGASDALGGFDVLSQDPDYVAGHAAGMKFRDEAEAMMKKLRAI